MKRFLLIVPSLFLHLSCSYAEPANLSLVKQEVKNYHDSGLYAQELAHEIAEAQQFIIDKAKHNTTKARLALVLDIDETSLSNYTKMAEHDFVTTREQLHEEILAANSPAIKPMLNLYNDAIKHGVKVFFITGRNESERAATQQNLNNAGFDNWAGLYLRPDNYKKPSIVPFKSQTRALIAQQGYTIIASIGDQDSDITGGYAEKGFKLPNPFYHLP